MRVDVLVAGGGIAGLAAAAAVSARGLSVLLADPAPPPDDASAPGADLRSTAYLQPSRDLLDAVGAWPVLAPHATPLEALEVIDTTGWPPRERARRRFLAADVSELPFGWNVPNWRARAALTAELAGREGVTQRRAAVRGVLARTAGATAWLEGGERIEAALVIGADGRGSAVREALGIEARVLRYGQAALAFAVRHTRPHGNVSTEIYNAGGAFTTVPLGDHEGQPASAVVWMHDAPAARRLAEAEPGAFAAEMALRSMGVLGEMAPITPLTRWPVVSQWARELTAPRALLLGEAAHAMPPIGAQGLNASLADVAALVAALEAGHGPGEPEMLAAYERARAADIRLRLALVDAFNRVARSPLPPLQWARRTGLAAAHDIAPLRRSLMRAGLGG